MSPGEIASRVREQVIRRAWSRKQVRPGQVTALPPPSPAGERRFTSALLADAASAVSVAAKAAILADADRIMVGEWEMLGVVRGDMKAPDWFRDPVTGRRSSSETYAFRINHRDEGAVGNIKHVWEVNWLQHLTLLAAAWYLTRHDLYAERVDAQLRSWWAANTFLPGVNWTSGIELGVRLINFAWIRRLLNEWPGVAGLFDRNDLALHHIRWHQQYLATFESRGSSANNHLIAEAAGQLAASFAAAVEAAAAGSPVSDDCWHLLAAMADGMAALSGIALITRLSFTGSKDLFDSANFTQAVSSCASSTDFCKAPEIDAEAR